MNISAMTVGIPLIVLALAAAFTVIKRSTGLPPRGVLELTFVRTVNAAANGAVTLLATLMFGATILALLAAFPAVWSAVGIIAVTQGGFGFVLELLRDTQLMAWVMVGTFLFSLFWCTTFLILELTDPDRTPPFSVLTFDRKKYS